VFGGETDAFVRVQIGDRIEALDGTVTDDMSVRTSCKVRNALNPVWNASDPCTNMTFGVQQAGTPLNIQVWDADSGLEFANDLIANVTEYVIPCSVMDSIDEPKTAWKDGELDPIAIKSNGKMAVPWRRQVKKTGTV
jgi:hypothetical protein